MIKRFLEEAGQHVWLAPFLIAFVIVAGALFAIAGYRPKQTPLI